MNAIAVEKDTVNLVACGNGRTGKVQRGLRSLG